MTKSERWVQGLRSTSTMPISLAAQVSAQIYKDLTTLELQQAKLYMTRVIVVRQANQERKEKKIKQEKS